MRQTTIGGFDDELAELIRQFASWEGNSLNRAVPRLSPGGANPGEPSDKTNVVEDSLDHLIGTWTAEEAAEMAWVLEDFSGIDEEMWR